jgi:hypothetical protein
MYIYECVKDVRIKLALKEESNAPDMQPIQYIVCTIRNRQNSTEQPIFAVSVHRDATNLVGDINPKNGKH